MKKYVLLSGLTTCLLLFSVSLASAQERGDDEDRPSKNAEATQTIGDTNVRVTYGSPSVKGRTIFGSLEPYGNVWRAGANEATTITFSTDVQVNGEDLAAGTYGFFVIPRTEGDWTVIFNNVPNQWGAFNYDETKDALRVMTTPSEGEHQETLVYKFTDAGDDSATLVLHWGTTMIPVVITTG
jgi:hypothetical protein